MKKIIHTQQSLSDHWVGDGFPVKSLISYHVDPDKFSPFLLLDHAGPARFSPSPQRRGVGDHPHRGFETVTIVYDGEVTHRDSVGNKGTIGPGDVQWMTAASGIIHQEMHSDQYAKTGGPFEMVQLWVNLPAKIKMSPPKYQSITQDRIPKVDLANKAGTLRVIAGAFQHHKGPAQTFSPMNVWDVNLNKNRLAELTAPENRTTAVAVLSGAVVFDGHRVVGKDTVALLDPKGEKFQLEAKEDAKVLILNGRPLNEPVVGVGPFVMNRKDEIVKATHDFETGKFVQSHKNQD